MSESNFKILQRISGNLINLINLIVKSDDKLQGQICNPEIGDNTDSIIELSHRVLTDLNAGTDFQFLKYLVDIKYSNPSELIIALDILDLISLIFAHNKCIPTDNAVLYNNIRKITEINKIINDTVEKYNNDNNVVVNDNNVVVEKGGKRKTKKYHKKQKKSRRARRTRK